MFSRNFTIFATKKVASSFEQAALEVDGVECWSARELQKLLGNSKWENFTNVINKAKVACENVGHNVSDHFPDVRKMVALGSGSERDIDDVMLTRYACYLIAQNGDPRKEQVAFAQTYFAVQTRKAELIEQRLFGGGTCESSCQAARNRENTFRCPV